VAPQGAQQPQQPGLAQQLQPAVEHLLSTSELHRLLLFCTAYKVQQLHIARGGVSVVPVSLPDINNCKQRIGRQQQQQQQPRSVPAAHDAVYAALGVSGLHVVLQRISGEQESSDTTDYVFLEYHLFAMAEVCSRRWQLPSSPPGEDAGGRTAAVADNSSSSSSIAYTGNSNSSVAACAHAGDDQRPAQQPQQQRPAAMLPGPPPDVELVVPLVQLLGQAMLLAADSSRLYDAASRCLTLAFCAHLAGLYHPAYQPCSDRLLAAVLRLVAPAMLHRAAAYAAAPAAADLVATQMRCLVRYVDWALCQGMLV
jgi:hypothetical protein